MPTRILTTLLMLFILGAMAEGLDVYRRYRIANVLIEESQATSFITENADMTILVLGDSVAVGTGTANPNATLSGRLFADFPNASVINKAEDGAEIVDAIEQLTEDENSYDLIVIQVGGNNILYFRSKEESVAMLEQLIAEAKEKAPVVVFMTSGNIGLVPGMPILLSPIYTKRTKLFLDSFKEVVDKYDDVYFVDLWTGRENNPFKNDPNRFYAPDGLHLSAYGYDVLYGEVRKVLIETGLLDSF